MVNYVFFSQEKTFIVKMVYLDWSSKKKKSQMCKKLPFLIGQKQLLAGDSLSSLHNSWSILCHWLYVTCITCSSPILAEMRQLLPTAFQFVDANTFQSFLHPSMFVFHYDGPTVVALVVVVLPMVSTEHFALVKHKGKIKGVSIWWHHTCTTNKKWESFLFEF